MKYLVDIALISSIFLWLLSLSLSGYLPANTPGVLILAFLGLLVLIRLFKLVFAKALLKIMLAVAGIIVFSAIHTGGMPKNMLAVIISIFLPILMLAILFKIFISLFKR